jgi:hypothetical protein
MATAPQPNYDYSGFGKAEALLIFSVLAANPSTVWLTTGFIGSVFFALLSFICTKFANVGIMLINIAATDLQTLVQSGNFDGSFDDAFKKILASKDPLTAAQKAAIDAPVIAAFQQFAVFGQLRGNSDTGNSSGDNPAG